jgi:hypothetical protein
VLHRSAVDYYLHSALLTTHDQFAGPLDSSKAGRVPGKWRTDRPQRKGLFIAKMRINLTKEGHQSKSILRVTAMLACPRLCSALRLHMYR